MSTKSSFARNISTSKLKKWILIGIGVLLASIIYKFFNPYVYKFFPECIFHRLTGYKCPGCGSQRAIYYLLNLNITQSLTENLLLVGFIPYVLLYIYFDIIHLKSENQKRTYDLLFGLRAFVILLLLIIGYGICRNISF